MASFDSFNPTAVIAWSQSPEWGEDAARCLAVSTCGLQYPIHPRPSVCAELLPQIWLNSTG